MSAEDFAERILQVRYREASLLGEDLGIEKCYIYVILLKSSITCIIYSSVPKSSVKEKRGR